MFHKKIRITNRLKICHLRVLLTQTLFFENAGVDRGFTFELLTKRLLFQQTIVRCISMSYGATLILAWKNLSFNIERKLQIGKSTLKKVVLKWFCSDHFVVLLEHHFSLFPVKITRELVHSIRIPIKLSADINLFCDAVNLVLINKGLKRNTQSDQNPGLRIRKIVCFEINDGYIDIVLVLTWTLRDVYGCLLALWTVNVGIKKWKCIRFFTFGFG